MCFFPPIGEHCYFIKSAGNTSNMLSILYCIFPLVSQDPLSITNLKQIFTFASSKHSFHKTIKCQKMLCIFIDIPCRNLCTPALICMFFFISPCNLISQPQPDVVGTNSNQCKLSPHLPPACLNNYSDKLVVISACTPIQPPTQLSNPIFPCALVINVSYTSHVALKK